MIKEDKILGPRKFSLSNLVFTDFLKNNIKPVEILYLKRIYNTPEISMKKSIASYHYILELIT